MGSSRFPGKPMALILGKPMIQHVFERVSLCPLITKTVVATCDQEILELIHSIGGEAVMTAKTHERATDRCAEACEKLEATHGIKYDVVVMIQGDEPMVHPEMISESLEPIIADPNIHVTNLMGEITNNEEFEDRNCIKVVCDTELNALYFSREPIPTRARNDIISSGKQVCVIPFRRQFLIQYTSLAPTPLELIESIDMLRVIEHGFKVRMVKTKYSTQSVDTLSDLVKVEEIIRSSKLY